MADETAGEPSHSGEEDENYFVSMTDMMVGILFIFIILLMVFALNFRTQTDVSEEQIERLEEAARQADEVADRLETLQGQVAGELRNIEAASRVRNEMLEVIRERLAQLGLVVRIDEANGVLRLTEDAIRFDVDSSDLGPRARTNVATVARVLADVLPEYAASGGAAAHVETVFIEGHTDITGNDDDNWSLSTSRAVNTYRHMTQVEPVLRTLQNDDEKEILSVSGYSSTRAVPDTPVSDYDVHRRIDLRFVMAVSDRDRLRTLLQITNDMEDQLTILQDAVENARGN